ncbi:MAG: hypothetical protein M0D54_09115 [Hyphomonadaceae bacterium JAD_PAG50586_4]|nr:MAG: hypothetical protein M0D54_09115 [Hyphomonadaceae bacterium JAD_PAG50586_4]
MRAPTLKSRLSGAVRPSIEALLLAAVALGCAQAGWTLLTPGVAGASTSTSVDETDDSRFESVEVQSPFAPDARGMASSSHAVAALLSSVQLNGVRMSTDPMRDGAMFTLGDGAQRAFMVGQEVADGVTLADVEASYVVLSYAGGERRLDMQAGPQFSFARAMMGLERAEGAPGVAAAPGADAVDVQVASRLSGADRAWLAATLANVETTNGVARGWRITETAPSAVREAGLQSGDLVTAINGAGPDDLGAVLAAARGDRLDVRVARGDTQLTFSLQIEERT